MPPADARALAGHRPARGPRTRSAPRGPARSSVEAPGAPRRRRRRSSHPARPRRWRPTGRRHARPHRWAAPRPVLARSGPRRRRRPATRAATHPSPQARRTPPPLATRRARRGASRPPPRSSPPQESAGRAAAPRGTSRSRRPSGRVRWLPPRSRRHRGEILPLHPGDEVARRSRRGRLAASSGMRGLVKSMARA